MYLVDVMYLFHLFGVPAALIGAPFLFRFPRARIPIMVALGFVIAFEIDMYRYYAPFTGFFIVVGIAEAVSFTAWWFAAWMRKPSPRGLPLVPLVLVVILAGNWLWFQHARGHRHMPGMRSKVARAKAEIRNLAMNLEDYYIDHDTYPPAVDLDGKIILFEDSENGISAGYVPWMLTTPKAYTSSLPHDPFGYTKGVGFGPYRYATNGLSCWIMTSRGPDLEDTIQIEEYPSPGVGDCQFRKFMTPWGGPAIEFDGTNGTMSKGDVLRVGP